MKNDIPRHDAFAVLKIRDFSLFVLFRFFSTIAIQMQSVIVGWQVYQLTKDPLSLGLIGLAEAIPFMLVALFAGHVADKFNRKTIILGFLLIFLTGTVLLWLFSFDFIPVYRHFGVLPIYLVSCLTGIARAFIYPAIVALIGQLVPRHLYANSSTWNSSVWHIAAVTGPAIGGMIYGFLGVSSAYFTVLCFTILSLGILFGLSHQSKPQTKAEEPLFSRLKEGIQFVFRNQVLLGAFSLDMFAVLFGGAVAMLPVFADEILHVGPQGLGFLRAAPALGAILMSFFLAYHPPVRNAGKKMFFAVTGFGLCIIFFALSHYFMLSLFLLFMSGMFDNVSVIIRSTVLQLETPDAMRGRVASVNSIFIGSSNEIGSFESGVAARFLGLIPSVIFGGTMTLLVVAITAKLSPRLKSLHLNLSP